MAAGNLFLISVLVAVISTTVHAEKGLDYQKDEDFQQWVSKYNKYGENLAEIYPTWRRNADFVKHHNSLGLSHTVSLNEFAHLNIDEMVGKQSWTVPQTFEQKPRVSIGNNIPTSLDWRDEGVVPPVHSQGKCDGAKLFAVLDSIDSFWSIKIGYPMLASQEECMDCCLKGGCNGAGLWDLSLYECIANLGGLAIESEYKSPNHTCLSDKYTPVMKISGGRYVVPSSSEAALAKAVATQPIAVAVDASHSSFQLYKDGVYYEPGCSSVKLDHGMLVVGYGSMNGEDYWIVKNSWGASWGMNGYILMARNRDNNCGIASRAMYPFYM